jgi:hypothetical protein
MADKNLIHVCLEQGCSVKINTLWQPNIFYISQGEFIAFFNGYSGEIIINCPINSSMRDLYSLGRNLGSFNTMNSRHFCLKILMVSKVFKYCLLFSRICSIQICGFYEFINPKFYSLWPYFKKGIPFRNSPAEIYFQTLAFFFLISDMFFARVESGLLTTGFGLNF